MGDLDKAIADYDAALRIDREHPHALFGRGKARLLKGDEPRGTFDITVAKRIKPDIGDEMSRYGFSRMAAAGNLVAWPGSSSDNNSIPKAQSACMPTPSGPAYEDWRKSALAFNGGLEFQKQKNHDRAAAQFDTAIKLYPSNALAHVARGQIYQIEGKYDRAIDQHSQAIKIAPSCFVAFNNRCIARALGGDLQAALADCDQALKLQPAYADTFARRGSIYFKMGDLDKAIAEYDAALQIDPNVAPALFGRGKARLMKGDESRGTVDITMAERIKPDIADEMSGYGIK
jgi:tetratricopeptide (TPR) repeat protein